MDERYFEFASPRQLELIKAYLQCDQNAEAAGRMMGVHGGQIRAAVNRVKEKAEGHIDEEKPLYDGRVDPFKRRVIAPPERGVNRFLLTSAQNNTPVHEGFWHNLLAYATYIDADLMVATFTYNHNSFGQLSTKRGRNKRQGDLWYDERIREFFCDDSVEIAPGLVWCGEMNILPTAVNPLSGLETYTQRKSGIFPAAKLDMKSVASGKTEPTKFNYTTGTVTKRNYIQKKAGQKAEFHHCYGALIVEVNSDGEWWVRQVIADRDGNFYDLEVEVRDGNVRHGGHNAAAIVWGDVHADLVDPQVADACWGENGLLELLTPEKQFLHDLLDFRRRNHHDRGNPHIAFRKYVEGEESVEAEVQVTADLLRHKIYREDVETIVVDSNHDNAFMRWLREADYRQDPVNAIYFLENQMRVYKAIRNREDDFHLVEWALRRKGIPKDIRFLRQDESYVVLPEIGGGIECGMHGDLGPNGARGTPNGLKRIGRRACTGHTHSAGIYDGLWVAGLAAMLDMGYNVGPSSWSHTMIVIQPNGKRQMVTIWNGKFRA